MKKLLIFTFLFLVCGSFLCPGQNAVTGNARKLKLASDISDYNDDYSPRSNGVFNFTFGLRREAFLNSNYFSYKEAGVISPDLYSVFLSYSVFVLNNIELEGEGFSSNYGFKAPDISAKTVTHSGLEVFANIFVLPPFGEWTSIVCPYVGVGYQFSHLKAVKQDYVTMTNGLMAKGGIRFYLMQRFVLKAEYKQSLPPGSEKLFRTFEVGVGITM